MTNHTAFSRKIAVIIVNYKTAELACRALDSLAIERAYLPNLETAIVDNASPDESYEKITRHIANKNYGSWIHAIQAPKNGGYAYGNNIGFHHFQKQLENQPEDKAEFYWLLNPDTYLRPKAGLHLAQHLTQHGPAIAGSRLEDDDGTEQISAFNFPNSASETLSGFGLGILDKMFHRHLVIRPVTDTPETVDWVAGASLMISSEVFEQVGTMDEQYFLYFEEVDYCLRIKRFGFPCWYLPTSRVVHEVGAATGISDIRKEQPRRPQYWFESRRRYFLKNFGVLAFLTADLGWALGYVTWCTRKRLTGSDDLRRQPPKLLRDLLKNGLLNPYRWRGNRSITTK